MSLTKIQSLTPQQEAELIAFRDYWLDVGRSTEKADRPKAERAVRRMYELLGEPAPYIWWSDGPAVASMVRTILSSKKRDNLGDNLRSNLWDNLWDNLGSNLRDNLRSNLWDNLRDNLGSNLRSNLGDNLWDNLRSNLGSNLGDNLRDNLWDNLGSNLRSNLGDNLWDNLRSNLWDNLRSNLWDNLGSNLRSNLGDNLWDNLGSNLWDNLRSNLWDNLGSNLRSNLWDNLWDNLGDNLGSNLSWSFWGQHECYWQAWLLFPHSKLREMHTPEQMERLKLWLDVSQSAGWWQPFKGVVFMCERPSRQIVDDRGRLHCEDGPALLCRDGFPVHAWHGVRVNYRIIEHPQDLTVGEIQQEKNAEVRRVMMERYGLSRFLIDSGAKKLAEDEFGQLYRTEVPDDEPLLMVKVLNSTPEPDGSSKSYFLRVQPELRPMLKDGLGEAQALTALNAVGSTFGMTGQEYLKQLVEQS